MLSRPGVFVPLLLVSVLLGGCSGSGILEEPKGVETLPEETGVASATVTPAASELLTVADAEAISGLTGLAVSTEPVDSEVHVDVVIADDTGQPVVALALANNEVWGQWVTDGITVGEPVTPPVGDESFLGPNPDVSPVHYIFGFRKGEIAVVITTFFREDTGEVVLGTEELRALAEVALGRLGQTR